VNIKHNDSSGQSNVVSIKPNDSPGTSSVVNIKTNDSNGKRKVVNIKPNARNDYDSTDDVPKPQKLILEILNGTTITNFENVLQQRIGQSVQFKIDKTVVKSEPLLWPELSLCLMFTTLFWPVLSADLMFTALLSPLLSLGLLFTTLPVPVL
jgi:hypothetical protein